MHGGAGAMTNVEEEEVRQMFEKTHTCHTFIHLCTIILHRFFENHVLNHFFYTIFSACRRIECSCIIQFGQHRLDAQPIHAVNLARIVDICSQVPFPQQKNHTCYTPKV